MESNDRPPQPLDYAGSLTGRLNPPPAKRGWIFTIFGAIFGLFAGYGLAVEVGIELIGDSRGPNIFIFTLWPTFLAGCVCLGIYLDRPSR